LAEALGEHRRKVFVALALLGHHVQADLLQMPRLELAA
jgi:hypothetical protein